MNLLTFSMVFFFCFSLNICVHSTNAQSSCTINTCTFDVGVILDLNSAMGKAVNMSISMALAEFYAIHGNLSSKLVLNVRDSKGDVMNSAAAALDLIEKKRVKAIISPEISEADFIAYIGNKSHVPILSFSPVSVFSSSSRLPYFFQLGQNKSSQVSALVDIVKHYQWKEVAIIHDDSQSGAAILPFLSDAFHEIGVLLSFMTVLPYNANSTTTNEALYKLKGSNMRVFIVHLPLPLGARFFVNVNQAGMMQSGYAWITTYELNNQLGCMDSSVLRSMEGVIGLKSYVPPSESLQKFKYRWRRQNGLKTPQLEPNMFWAYDSIFLLAMAVNRTSSHLERNLLSPSSSNRSIARNRLTVFDNDVSLIGSELLQSVIATQFTGLSGKVQFVDRQLQLSSFEIINLGRSPPRVGYWTPSGLSQRLSSKITAMKYTDNEKNLGDVVWPGGSIEVPYARILRVGVPHKPVFPQFINVTHVRNGSMVVKVDGFSVDVFKKVMEKFRYGYQYEAFEHNPENLSLDYNNLTYQVYLKKYDVVMGDITIRSSRAEHVSFTPAYSAPGIRMIVPAKKDEFTQGLWWFCEPLQKELWFTTIAFFLWKGIVIWIFEHRINPEFQGTISQQWGKILSFSFSTVIFSHKERLESNYSRFVINVWTFAIFVLVTSYGANLTSMLAFENLKPTISDLKYLQKNGHSVGYQDESFVGEFLKTNWGFSEKQLKNLSTVEDYVHALSAGTDSGGVSAIVDEIPYVNLFLNKYCREFTVAGPIYPSGGLGFVFPKYSPLLSDVSKEVLSLTESGEIEKLQQKWLLSETCQDPLATNVTSNRLRLYSFRSIYLILAVASALALLLFVVSSIYRSFKDYSAISFRKRISGISRWFNFKKPVSTSNNFTGGEQPARAEGQKKPHEGLLDTSVKRAVDHMPENTFEMKQIQTYVTGSHISE